MPRAATPKTKTSHREPAKAPVARRRPAMAKDSLTQLQKAVKAFCREREWEQFHSPKNVAMALAIEAAELMEPMRWLSEAESRNLTQKVRQDVTHEIGDVMFCLINLCERLGIDPIEACRAKLELSAAKY